MAVMNPVSAIGFVWIAWFVSWMLAAGWSSPTVKQTEAARSIPYRLTVIVGIILLAGLYPHRFSSEGILWRASIAFGWVMVALTVTGFLFMWWARIHLGKLWSAEVRLKAGHHIVDTGPYGLVRHPIYTGVIVAGFASAILRGTVAGFLGASLMTVSWYLKARLEERFLREQLGAEAYDAYAKRVPMLVPFLRPEKS